MYTKSHSCSCLWNDFPRELSHESITHLTLDSFHFISSPPFLTRILCVILVYLISTEAKLNLFCDFSALSLARCCFSSTYKCVAVRTYNGEVACNLTTCVCLYIFHVMNISLLNDDDDERERERGRELWKGGASIRIWWMKKRSWLLFLICERERKSISWINCLHGNIYEGERVESSGRDEKGFILQN